MSPTKLNKPICSETYVAISLEYRRSINLFHDTDHTQFFTNTKVIIICLTFFGSCAPPELGLKKKPPKHYVRWFNHHQHQFLDLSTTFNKDIECPLFWCLKPSLKPAKRHSKKSQTRQSVVYQFIQFISSKKNLNSARSVHPVHWTTAGLGRCFEHQQLREQPLPGRCRARRRWDPGAAAHAADVLGRGDGDREIFSQMWYPMVMTNSSLLNMGQTRNSEFNHSTSGFSMVMY